MTTGMFSRTESVVVKETGKEGYKLRCQMLGDSTIRCTHSSTSASTSSGCGDCCCESQTDVKMAIMLSSLTSVWIMRGSRCIRRVVFALLICCCGCGCGCGLGSMVDDAVWVIAFLFAATRLRPLMLFPLVFFVGLFFTAFSLFPFFDFAVVVVEIFAFFCVCMLSTTSVVVVVVVVVADFRFRCTEDGDNGGGGGDGGESDDNGWS